MVKLFTIGYSGKSAHLFFDKLQRRGVKKVIDVRVNPSSSYAYYTHQRDLPFFLRQFGMEYAHKLLWAPTPEIKSLKEWNAYEKAFKALMVKRDMFARTTADDINMACLLCSEADYTQCHRGLLAEALKEKFPEIEVVHL